MIHAAVRKNDGLSTGRIWLRSVVRNAQLGLRDAGFPVTVDGRFGTQTETAVSEFQRARGLRSSRIVDRDTWGELSPHIGQAASARREAIAAHLSGFHGDLDWVHEQEGHVGRAYWPGGASGVTLDPGLDVGHAERNLVLSMFDSLLGQQQLQALEAVMGLKGEPAKRALEQSPVLQSIRISREQAEALMPIAAREYWTAIRSRFARLGEEATLPSVQTVLLSLAYNRGPRNRHLEPLDPLIRGAEWAAVAERVGGMQQRHELKGIRIRRRHEAALIRAELEFLES